MPERETELDRILNNPIEAPDEVAVSKSARCVYDNARLSTAHERARGSCDRCEAQLKKAD